MVKSVKEYFANEHLYPELNEEEVVSHFSKAIQCKTISYVDKSKIDYSELEKLHELMKDSYPNIFKIGNFELIGHSVLIKITGSDTSLKPSLFMSHQDVVPVVDGTEDDWKYPPFSGEVAEGYIWGRGTIDIKCMVFGILEAVEYLLKHGYKFKRTIYLAFGEDEETLNRGAYNIGKHLEKQGVILEYVLDEGGGEFGPATVYGAPNVNITQISLFEKGYADLLLKAYSKGGHSSRPFGGTSLGALSKTISTIVEYPFEAKLSTVCRKALEQLAPYITEEPMITYVKDIDRYEKEIIDYYLNNESLFNQIITTVSPNMINGGSSAGNVMPQNMEAVVNFRTAPQDRVEDIISNLRKVIDSAIDLSYIQANNASDCANVDGYGYNMLVENAQEFFKDIVFIPLLTTGATDAQHYEIVCDSCLRFSPFVEENEIEKVGVHGTNERMSIRSYMHGIRFLISLMKKTC